MVLIQIHNAIVTEKVTFTMKYLPNLVCYLVVPGILCGTCEDGYGVSALLNHCVSCHDANAVLIILLCKLHLVQN